MKFSFVSYNPPFVLSDLKTILSHAYTFCISLTNSVNTSNKSSNYISRNPFIISKIKIIFSKYLHDTLSYNAPFTPSFLHSILHAFFLIAQLPPTPNQNFPLTYQTRSRSPQRMGFTIQKFPSNDENCRWILQAQRYPHSARLPRNHRLLWRVGLWAQDLFS